MNALVAILETVTIFGTILSVPTSTTVANLPTCNAALSGTVFRVTDALLPTLSVQVAGGGSTSVLVRCNGTNWTVGA